MRNLHADREVNLFSANKTRKLSIKILNYKKKKKFGLKKNVNFE